MAPTPTPTPTKKSGSPLPPGAIVRLGKFAWTTMWRLMMSKLAPRNSSGEYIRPESQFRHNVGTAAYPPEAGRYQLIVGWGCPWAHRTLVVRALKGLSSAISINIVSPSPDSGMWVFDQPEVEFNTLPQFYHNAKPGYQGRATVPLLWDTQQKAIVNNESAEIIVMLNSEFQQFAKYPDLDLYPPALKEAIDSWNEQIYHHVNNGVYRCGFAATQTAYETACNQLFDTLDLIDQTLANSRYLCGDRITLADVRLFTTLVRFDTVYYSLFKCQRRRLVDYPNLSPYLRDIYQLPGVDETCNLEVIKRDYYGNLFPLNPGGIIPLGPDLELHQPHYRDRLTKTN
ncbi:MAG: glutathione S-transferase family protein [Arthrospira sp. SH-MAG29]|nr:glutathione S-transferase family protein [Arthrospira sp. SH-MAG29]MBS0018421.1 glutathione S-transferase family protein [Arthrospira sp. SH-MAG29]